MCILVALDAIAQYQSRLIDPVASAGGTPSTPRDKNDDTDKPSDDERQMAERRRGDRIRTTF